MNSVFILYVHYLGWVRNMDENKLCIYISSPESYSDVLDVFIRCFEMNWPSCKYPVVISTNSPKELGDNYYVKVINVAPDNWVTRTICCLSELEYDYILLMMDDSIIMKSVNDSDIDMIVKEMDEYNLNYCKMTAAKKGVLYKDSKLLNKVRKDTPYARNIFMGVYRRTYLLNELGDGSLSAWDIEKKWLEEARNSRGSDWYEDVVLCNKTIISVRNGVIKGVWFPSVKKEVARLGIRIESERQSTSFINEFKMNLGARLGTRLHPKIRLFLKKVLGFVGVNFATNR